MTNEELKAIMPDSTEANVRSYPILAAVEHSGKREQLQRGGVGKGDAKGNGG